MNYMKKSINNIIIFSLLTFGLLFFVSCKKENKIWVYENDYSFINQNIEIDIFTNIEDNPYLKKESITSIYLYDKNSGDLFPFNILNIDKYKINRQKFKNCLELGLNLKINDLIKIKEGYIVINYINNYELKIFIGSLSIINVKEDYDLNISSLEGNVESERLNSIEIGLLNNRKDIKILEVLLINAKLENLVINKKLEDIEYLKIDIDSDITNTGIVIKYEINNEERYKVIHNFKYLNNYQYKENIYYV